MKKSPAINDTVALKVLQEKLESLTSVQSFSYSEDLNSVMIHDVVTCSPETSVKEAARCMINKNVSSVIVIDSLSKPIGILTSSDIMRWIVAVDGCDSGITSVVTVMSKDVVSLTPDNSMFRALSILAGHGIKHLPLIRNNKICGMVTLRQILKLRYPEPMTIIEGINSAHDTNQLNEIKRSIPKIIFNKLNIGIRAIDVVTMISMINRDMHRRVIELVIEQMGPPPAPFCIYVTGSHGRLENLMSTDQDHGMIIADSEDGLVQYDPYYIELSDSFSTLLNEIGYDFCPGSIMCRNPLWRKSLSEWKVQIKYWIDKQVPELGRFSTVLFDAAPIYGDVSLFKEMSDFAFRMLHSNHEVSLIMSQEEASHKVPTDLLGRFITEKSGEHKGELEIKRSGLIFIIEGIRILALRHGVREISTLKRIKKLIEGKFIHPDDGEYIIAAYHFLIHLALHAQVDKCLQGEKIDTFINPNKLSQRDRETLKHAFKAVSSMKDLVAADFGEMIL